MATFFAGAWTHAQGAVSAAASLMKADIYDAVRAFVRCNCYVEPVESTVDRDRLRRTPSVRVSGAFVEESDVFSSTMSTDNVEGGNVPGQECAQVGDKESH